MPRIKLLSPDREQNVNRIQAVCYLIHLQTPYIAKSGNLRKRAQHYLGWSINLDKRIKLHATNRGARLLAVVNAEKIPWAVVRVWENGSYQMEQELKARHRHADYCPVCNPELRHLLPKEVIGTGGYEPERGAPPQEGSVISTATERQMDNSPASFAFALETSVAYNPATCIFPVEYKHYCQQDTDEQRTIVREAVGGCLAVNIMPSGDDYIEAVCVWTDRSAYVLLCRHTRRIIRRSEVESRYIASSSDRATQTKQSK